MSTRLRFQAVVEFEIEENEAAHILSDPKANHALHEHMMEKHHVAPAIGGYLGDFNRNELHKALGAHLAERKISEQKQLPVSTGS